MEYDEYYTKPPKISAAAHIPNRPKSKSGKKDVERMVTVDTGDDSRLQWIQPRSNCSCLDFESESRRLGDCGYSGVYHGKSIAYYVAQTMNGLVQKPMFLMDFRKKRKNI